jgi:phage tail protein X
MGAVMQHGRIEAVRLQKLAKQIAYDRIVVDDKDLWIHGEILDWRARRATGHFLTNTYCVSRGAGGLAPRGQITESSALTLALPDPAIRNSRHAMTTVGKHSKALASARNGS